MCSLGSRASLARVGYGDPKSHDVALCLKTQGAQERLILEDVGKVFTSIFGSHKHLGTTFLRAGQEAEVFQSSKGFLYPRIGGAIEP
jgi:hypothetical protein